MIFRKVRFRDQRANILEDDQWLNADQARRDAEYRELVSKVVCLRRQDMA
jgi:hypothetical protein